VTRIGDRRSSYIVLVGSPVGKRELGRPRRTWEDNIKMYLQAVGWGGMDWTHMTQDMDKWRALVNVVKKIRVP
jgi:hypothetical protein